MPVPIRPVKVLENNTPSILTDGGFSAMGLSDLQINLIGMEEVNQKLAKKCTVDSRDAELLQDIWNSQNEKLLTKVDNVRDIKMSVPDDISDSAIIRMKTNGLIVGPDRKVSLTSRGEKVLKNQILSQTSSYFLNRKKEKFNFDKD